MKLLASLSRPQRIAVCVGMAAVFLTLLFPPWEYLNDYAAEKHHDPDQMGRRFLLGGADGAFRISVSVLVVQLTMIAVGTGAAVMALGLWGKRADGTGAGVP